LKDLKTIDIHTHIIPEHLPRWSAKFGYGGFIHLEHHKSGCARMMQDDIFFREILANCWDPEIRIQECGHFHCDMQVLSTIPVMFNYHIPSKDCLDVSQFLNDHIAGICRDFPTKFIGLGTIPMQDPELACRELERCMKELGMAGIQIGTNINDINLSEPAFFPFWKLAESLGASIFVHPWNMMGQKSMNKYWLPWLVGMPAESSRAISSLIFGGIFEKFPKLRFAFAHGGGSFPATVGRLDHGHLMRPDLCALDNEKPPRHYCGHFWVDSLVHDQLTLDFLLNIVGENKIVLGTDYPFPLGENVPGELIHSMSWTEERKKRILWDNAMAWLGK
jgi:aminocarboxymuconate-semialdehyde decarboxylase